jgi:5-methylthioadenosine/S-adenosylhomocysteine deaminase
MAVHMTQLSDEDIQLIAETGSHIIHCPESNLKLASGFCPVAKCLEAGINVALGTDSAASNNNLDMFGEMRTAALLAKGVAQDARAVPAMEAIKMATINGAKALGIDDKTGSLSIGKSADMIAIDMDSLETLPLFDPISQIVYASDRHQVTDVWVAGKQLLKQRNLTAVNVDDLKGRVVEWQKLLKKT